MSQPRVIYSAAISLDGYIADADGGVDWLHDAMVKGESYDLPEFQRSIDGVLMGSRTYEKALAMGAGGSKKAPVWVFSKRELPARKYVTVTSASPAEVVATIAARGITRAWLMGGGLLASSFLRDGLLDEVALGVMPVVLGAGIPAFGPLHSRAKLNLVESKAYKGGAMSLRYEPVRPKSRR
jgi:dihydrofolate reductase